MDKFSRRVPPSFARLTPEDRAIFDSRTHIATEAEYRYADERDAQRVRVRMKHGVGEVTGVYRAMEVSDQFAPDELQQFIQSRRRRVFDQLASESR